MLSYYNFYLRTYEDFLNGRFEFFPSEDIFNLISDNSSDDDKRTLIEGYVSNITEYGFNKGFSFALKIFSNNL